jgi:hypothetical protein
MDDHYDYYDQIIKKSSQPGRRHHPLVVSVLTKRKDLFEDAVVEAILGIKLAVAMEEGHTGEYKSEEIIFSKLSD